MLENRIEDYLLNQPHPGWVKSDTLCAVFEINERQLRSVGGQQGLCSAFAISGDKGFKHVTKATPAEYKRFKHRLRKHAINELRRVSRLDRRRHQVTQTTKRPEFTREKDTGQGLLFTVPVQRPF
jgi:hypothetical protein